MQTIQIDFEAGVNIQLFIEWLSKFDNIRNITLFETKEIKTTNNEDDYSHLPIEWGKQRSKIDDLAGIWEGKGITLEQIREKAWKRNW